MPSTGVLPGNLPRQLTSFIGRERELRDLKELLERSRLLTLTGPGGSGKTRLGLQLAADVASGFPGGVYFVALAPVGNPDLVLSSIAQGVGLGDVGNRPLLERLCSHLESARVLLLLDNFEHPTMSAPVVAALLRATADKGDGVVLQTRALGIHARALEVFDLMGLADRFVEHGQVVRRFHMYTDGKTLVRLELSRNGSAFGFMLDVPQDVTETILRQRVGELGGRVEQGTELNGLHLDPGGVTATITEPGGSTRTITADYVVGADGAHSSVRSELGLDFRGHPYTQDQARDHDPPHAAGAQEHHRASGRPPGPAAAPGRAPDKPHRRGLPRQPADAARPGSRGPPAR